MKPGQDLLVGVLGVRLGFLRADDVLACARELLRPGEHRSLGGLLRERGLLSDADFRAVESMAATAIDATGGDPTRTLELLPPEVAALVASMREPVEGPPRSTTQAMPSLELSPEDLVVKEQVGQYTPLIDPSGAVLELGRGGAGRVVLVHDTFLGREVARKELLRERLGGNADTLTTSTLEARFLREARLTGQLEHPSVVPVYEVGRRADGSVYYTMLRVRGRTLHEAMRAAKTLRQRLALLEPLLKVCQCIASAHDRGVLHRDVKPQNVMLGRFGEVYVVDWGLARMVSQTDERSGEFSLAPDITGGSDLGALGTPAYMSPEHAQGTAVGIDERSDVFSLGAMLFELLTGRPPFLAPSPIEVVARLRTEAAPSVRTLAPKVPRELAIICDQALARDPSARYADAGALSRDLKAFLDGRMVAAYQYSAWELAARSLRRRRAIWVPALSAVVALVAAAVVSLAAVGSERDRARNFATAFLGDVSERLSEEQGMSPLVNRVTSVALEHYQRTGGLDGASQRDKRTVGAAFARLALLSQRLGRLDEAQRAVDFGRPLLTRPTTGGPTDVEAAVAWASLDCTQAALDLNAKRVAPARLGFEACETGAAQVAALPEARARALSLAVSAQSGQAQVARLQGRNADAEAALLRAVRTGGDEVATVRGSVEATLRLSENHAALAQLAEERTERIAAAKHHDAALAAAREAATAAPTDQLVATTVLRRLVAAAVSRAVVDGDSAATLFTEAVERGDGLLRRWPEDVAVQALLVEADAHLGHRAQVWDRCRALEKRGALGAVGPSAVRAAYLAGALEDAIRLSGQPAMAQTPTALLYRALAAAQLERPGDALVAARALQGRASTASWLPGQVQQAAAGTGPLAQAVRDFAAALDAAFVAQDTAAPGAALDALVAALEARP